MERWLTSELFSLANARCTACKVVWWVLSIYASGALSAWATLTYLV